MSVRARAVLAVAACALVGAGCAGRGGEAANVGDPAVAVTTVAPAATTPETTLPVTAAAPVPTTAARQPAAGCPSEGGHAAVVDRDRQRAWLCDGPYREGDELRVTTAITQPKPGTYPVYTKVRMTTSTFGGHLSYLDRFVAFSYGWRTHARIAFHAVPRSAKGVPFQALDTVGDLGQQGESSGCIRVLPDDAVRIWNWLSLGDKVVVIS